MSEKVDRAIHALKTNPILMHKYAATSDIAKAIGLQIAAAGAGALAFAGVAKGMEALSQAKGQMQKSKNIARMLAVNPELRTVDPTKLSLAYDTLVRVAPKTAVDPLLAGQFIRNTLQVASTGGVHVSTQDLATLARMHDGKVHPVAEQFGAQLRGAMGAHHAGQLLAIAGQEARQQAAEIRAQANEARQQALHGGNLAQQQRQQELHPGALAAQGFAAEQNARQQALHPGALMQQQIQQAAEARQQALHSGAMELQQLNIGKGMQEAGDADLKAQNLLLSNTEMRGKLNLPLPPESSFPLLR
jgi:hypothetical protein